jgi:predicted transposase YbfD/YdcC
VRRYYVSSATLSAARFAGAVRAHWRIENTLHWVLGTAFDEDRARNRRDHGPENLAILRKLALNILRSARPDISIRRKCKRSGWSDDFARSVLGQMR